MINNIKSLVQYFSARMCLYTEILQWPIRESEEHRGDLELCINVSIFLDVVFFFGGGGIK
jgi:hypothetical protein